MSMSVLPSIWYPSELKSVGHTDHDHGSGCGAAGVLVGWDSVCGVVLYLCVVH